jgi:hypothetical protein
MTKYLVCKCGWKSEPYPDNTLFLGLGGTLSCPECTKVKRNPTLEGLYGHVHSITVDEPYNPSKRKNIPEIKRFYCEFTDLEVDSNFCANCGIKLEPKIKCHWKRLKRKKGC